ncbi:MAG: alpha/beta hydrolase [Clostridia bacterium]|nr:alpha/beta hydrolase [Clostridia bacterium]
MKTALQCNGRFATVDGHNIHIYAQGKQNAPAIVFMAGHCTISPVYDFKVLFEKLIPDFRIIVTEKFGYGYSDIWDAPSDIDSLVSVQRQALRALGETGPYILAPHSMSGLEAIRWKQTFPDEVSAIIGIDMATPLSFSVWSEEDVQKTVRLMKFMRRLKLGNILVSLKNQSLTEDEIKQHTLLKKRNAFNICCINEAREVLHNAKTVENGGAIQCPTLMFSSNGKDQEKDWVENQQKFAQIMGAKLVSYDCAHDIHQYKSDDMQKEIVEFVNALEK